MYTIDISKVNLNLFTKEELVSYAEQGLLVCADVDLGEFVGKILEGSYSEYEIEQAQKHAHEEGYQCGLSEGYKDGKEDGYAESGRTLYPDS